MTNDQEDQMDVDLAQKRRCREQTCGDGKGRPLDPKWEAGAIISGYAAEHAAAILAGFCSTLCQSKHAAKVVEFGLGWWQQPAKEVSNG